MTVILDKAGLFVYLFCLFFYLLLRGMVQVSEGQRGGYQRGRGGREKRREREAGLTQSGAQAHAKQGASSPKVRLELTNHETVT